MTALSDYFLTQPRGTSGALCRAIGTVTPDMAAWTVGRRRVPVERCIAIEQALNGAVRCESMRPDIPWAVLRVSLTSGTIK